LAREPTTDNVNGFEVVLSALSDIPLPVNLWPMLGENPVCVVVNFHLPFADHSSPLKTKVKPTDSGEQTSKRDGF
jgi:hypothetical protein